MTLDSQGRVIEFSREHGQLEWTGLALVETQRLRPGTHHVYHLLEPLMPVNVMKISTKEIDTVHDYDVALEWLEHGCEDEEA